MFANRIEAGKQLAEKLAELGPENPVVLALPRGGVPVANEVAKRLKAPLDLVLVRKIGSPGHEELAAGAIVDGEEAQVVFNPDVLRMLGLTESDFEEKKRQKLAEIEERRKLYLAGRAPLPLDGKTAIIVDDGIATGATVKAALKGVAKRGPKRIVLAIPVAPPDSLADLDPLVDDLICLEAPDHFYAVGAHYRDFGQTSDTEVQRLMREADQSGN
ncbi:phosphoribosyltransferase [Ostreiculturibacter nitratireducens]|uniref:phosphoribosyltransferase n=1 Tax=Ostreiculturibacter nitratireducens TaxID=3075226 RepID=UPI0031B636C8